MPRYHFDTECGDLRYEDPDGLDLASIDHAREQLLGLLRDLTFHEDMAGAGKTITAQVRCRDDIVLHGYCSLAIDRPAVWSPKL